jgi:hypothetical protein
MYALTKSMITLATTTTSAKHDDDPLHRGVVAVLQVREERVADPGQLNVVSVSTAPESRRATVNPRS